VGEASGLQKETVLVPLGHMFVTNYGHNAEFRHDPKRVGSKIGTAGVVADVFREQFFTAFWTDEACLDRYLRNRTSP